MFGRKKEKVPDKEVARNFFSHPITEKILELIAEKSDAEMSFYINDCVKPAVKLLKSIVIRAQFGAYSEEDAQALFCTPLAAKLRERLMAVLKDD